MPCWVVPTIAAEYWRIPLDEVLDRIARNAVPIRHEDGFTFIDILPDPAPAQPLPANERPATFVAAPPKSAIRNPQSEINKDWVSHNPTRVQTATLRRAPSRAA
jgi:hypothetical protein